MGYNVRLLNNLYLFWRGLPILCIFGNSFLLRWAEYKRSIYILFPFYDKFRHSILDRLGMHLLIRPLRLLIRSRKRIGPIFQLIWIQIGQTTIFRAIKIPFTTIDILYIELVMFLYLMILGALRPEFVYTSLAWLRYLHLPSRTAAHDFCANTPIAYLSFLKLWALGCEHINSFYFILW